MISNQDKSNNDYEIAQLPNLPHHLCIKHLFVSIEGVGVFKNLYKKTKSSKIYHSTDKVIISKMKLFASSVIASTAAMGQYNYRFAGRVTNPDGFVNEQGGFWADQPSDQSQQPQQRQWPQGDQSPQCCNGYFWTGPTGERVWMSHSGIFEHKPYYTGKLANGNEKVLYWAFDTVQRSWDPVPGHWYFGDQIGSKMGTKSAPSTTLRYCPTDQINNWGMNLKLECAQDSGQQQQHGHPHDQSKQCCEGFNLNFNGKSYEMKRNSHHDGRPVYQGEVEGQTRYLIWKFHDVPDNRPVQAVPGDWILTPGAIDDPDRIVSKTLPHDGYKSCPNDQKVSWPSGSKIDLSCKNVSPTPEAETCNERAVFDEHTFSKVDSKSPPFFFDINRCHIQSVMRLLVNQQIDDALKILNSRNTAEDRELASNASSVWQNAATEWEAMTRMNGDKTQCGNKHFFSNKDLRFAGSVPNCDNMCKHIEKITEPKDIAPVIEGFLSLVKSEFNTSKYKCL